MSASCDPDGPCQGNCCSPVVLPISQREAAMRLPGDKAFGPGDRDWILHDLTPVLRRDGLARDPWLAGSDTIGLVDGQPSVAAMFFYDCRHYDPERRRCNNYDGRPRICRDYPWGDRPPDPAAALPPGCAYIEDVPVQFRRRR